MISRDKSKMHFLLLSLLTVYFWFCSLSSIFKMWSEPFSFKLCTNHPWFLFLKQFFLCWCFVAALGFSLVAAIRGYSLVMASRGYSSVPVHGLLIVMASLIVEHGSSAWASVGVAHGLSCFAACGIFLEQGLNPCLLHWRVDSLLLSHQGSPNRAFVKQNFD